MSIFSFSKQECAARRAQLVVLVCHWCRERFDSNGRWIGTEKEPNTRGRFWLCFGLLQGEAGDVQLANAILDTTEYALHVPARTEEEAEGNFDIFVNNHATQIVAVHHARLLPRVRRKLERWARLALRDYPGDRQADYQFHGHNDNMPCKATMGLILGGEYFKNAKAVEHGLWNLRQLADLLTRRGLLSEYTSPTYAPFSLLNLTEIATHARNREARTLSAEALSRIWADVLGHYHGPTGMMGGPFSRAYTIDSTGHLSNLSILLWLTFGDVIFPNPVQELSRKKMRLVHHENDVTSVMGLCGWLSSGHYEPPIEWVDWAARRQYPFRLRATAERGDGGQASGASTVISTSYQEREFILGSSDAEEWSFGESVFLRYGRRLPARGIEEVRTLYSRYLIDDEKPSDADHLLVNHGVTHCLQKDRIVVALSHPKMDLAGRELRSLRYSVIVPTHFGKVEKTLCSGGHFYIQDGPLYIALRPLNASVWGGGSKPRTRQHSHYLEISFPNYSGPARRFSEEELGQTMNGMVMMIGLRREESFSTFQRRMEQAELQDAFSFGCRTVRYRLGKNEFGLSYGLRSNGVRYATINGRVLPTDPWQADGLPAERLPFLDGARRLNGLRLPYRQLGVIWAPRQPWLIASVGKSLR